MTEAGLHATVDTSFTTMRRDMFTSGLAAQIGGNAFIVWCAIKYFADYSTGKAWPGMRAIADKVGLGLGSVKRAIDVLVDAKLVRVVGAHSKQRGQTYVATERLLVTVGHTVLCTVVIDYVPSHLPETMQAIEQAIREGKPHPKAFANCTIIPGNGFVWDASRGVLENARLPVTEIQQAAAPAKHLDTARAILGMPPKKCAG